ncbi:MULTISPECIES: Rne/Rng family ribonuclease [Kamptonema]|uniref:Rne/Rng family ribonuclease n=1 Tax=Kamptonema TaxID=1501433 RepID=UPI0001DACCF8|nr:MULTISPECIES: Rne/Rng family ribonuclease [Kamptonema]CBN59233.1 ribonuclease [Kamptonema sp. PCC 6506]
MPKQIVIAEQHRLAAVFSEDQIQELVVATGSHQVSDIYLGIVENVLPGIDAAFVNIGDPDRNGFMHVTDLGPLRLKRSAGAITELLAPQQKVLVQVMKEPTGTKGPRLTGNITLPGRYLVLMPYGRGVNLSRRIKSENERNRLRALAILVKPAGMGLLVRTEAEGMTEEAIIEDLEVLQKQWEAVQQEGSSTRAPALLNRDDDFIQRVLRDMFSNDVNRIVVDSQNGIKRVKQHLMAWNGNKLPPGVLIDHHRERIPMLEYFRVNPAIREALRPRVDLPSGGYIIIQPTEALTVIDVNSGSFTRSATARETVLWTNCEAATEIARQLRLRNIAGVIIVDFIDMESRRDQLQVLEHFNKALRADKARPQIAQLSELGLVELTRKRQGQNIYELFGHTCPSCGGLGHLVQLPGEDELAPAVRDFSTARESAASNRSLPRPAFAEILPTVPEVPERRSLTGTPRHSFGESPGPVREERSLEPARAAWEAQNEGLDFDGNSSSSLDLINHPSYQDLGNGARRRRSRQRLGEGNLPVREEEPTRSKLRVPSVPSMADSRGEYLGVPGVRASSETFPIASTIGQRRDRDDLERVRPARPELMKPMVEPPEVIAVEMTPEEQDVYALMGVSPLLLLDRTVKNPKNAIISVTLPGQGGTAPQVERSPVEAESAIVTEQIGEESNYAKDEPDYGRQELDYSRQEPDYSRQELDYSRQEPDYARQESDYARQESDYAKDEPDYARQEPDYAAASLVSSAYFEEDSDDYSEHSGEVSSVAETSRSSEQEEQEPLNRRRRRRSSALVEE